jgi:hypothetical protein
MFFATPRLCWNSPKRFIPSKASRMMSSDHWSPTMSSARAIGHASFFRLFLWAMQFLLRWASVDRNAIQVAK